MNIILQHPKFADWLSALKDHRGAARILARINSARLGNFGDWKSVGDGVEEMRINTGPGYRDYYTRHAQTNYLLLAGGDKSTQQRDIAVAKQRASDAED